MNQGILKWLKDYLRVIIASIGTAGTVYMTDPGHFDIFTRNGAWSFGKVIVVMVLSNIFVKMQKDPIWDGDERRYYEKKLNEVKPESEFNPLGLDDIRGRD